VQFDSLKRVIIYEHVKKKSIQYCILNNKYEEEREGRGEINKYRCLKER